MDGSFQESPPFSFPPLPSFLVCMCVPICTFEWRLEINLECHSSHATHILFFWERFSHWPGTCWFRLASPRDSHLALALLHVSMTAFFFFFFLNVGSGIQTDPYASLNSSTFTDYTVSPAQHLLRFLDPVCISCTVLTSWLWFHLATLLPDNSVFYGDLFVTQMQNTQGMVYILGLSKL